MNFTELQEIIAKLEKEESGVSNALERAKAHNAKLSQRITKLTKKNPEKKRGAKGNVTI